MSVPTDALTLGVIRVPMQTAVSTRWLEWTGVQRASNNGLEESQALPRLSRQVPWKEDPGEEPELTEGTGYCFWAGNFLGSPRISWKMSPRNGSMDGWKRNRQTYISSSRSVTY
ncbi:hypothetical protein AMECASPLE_010498 [Ameca splendens]|uniref:Uncharacterized protein n=1 Tax=Ameca splendens TaxID=208324 RepID=A0ABV0YMK2_9TELE